MKQQRRMLKPERVLVAHPSADLYGSDRVVLETVRGLVLAGAQVTVTVPTTGPLVGELEARGAEVIICDTVILRRSLLSRSGLVKLVPTAVTALARSMALLLKLRPGSVYVNTLTLPLWSLLPRLLGCKVIVHVHEAEDSERPMVKRAMTAPLLFATDILINSRFSRGVLVAAQPRLAGRITIVDNAIPGPTQLHPPRLSVHGPIRLLYVGRLSHRKGVDIAVDSLAELSARGLDAQLDIVGAVYPGNEAYETKLVEMVQAYGLSERVHFHGFHQDIWPFLAQADISIVPARLDESFGNTAVEALLGARPVIVSDTSGLREAAGAYTGAEFVPPANPTAVADAVEKICSNWSEWTRRAIGDAASAAARHSPELYQNLIAAQLLPSLNETGRTHQGARDGLGRNQQAL